MSKLSKIFAALVLPVAALSTALPASADALDGTWHAYGGVTAELASVAIVGVGSTRTIHGFGRCVPKSCDWGIRPLLGPGLPVFGTGTPGLSNTIYTAKFDFGYETKTLTMKAPVNGILTIHEVRVRGGKTTNLTETFEH